MSGDDDAGSTADVVPLLGRRRATVKASVIATAAAWSLVAVGSGLVLSAAVGATDGGAAALALVGTLSLLVGAVTTRFVRLPAKATGPDVLTAGVLASLVMVTVSTIAYLASGAIERVDDALFESIAGFSTTSATVLSPVGDVERDVLFWRATTQWIGGLAALQLVAVVIPTFGRGRDQILHESVPGVRPLAPRVQTGVRRVSAIYAGMGAVLAMAYLAAGMGPFDCVTYAMTTISTGGFANHDGSIAFFDSAGVEVVAIIGMLLGGTSIVALWWAVRGAVVPIWRSTELRAYGLIVVASTVLVSAWTWTDSGGGVTTVRESLFTVASAVSTTGYSVTDWTTWIWGAQFLLLILIGTGPMSSSAGGGFSILRAIEAVRYTYRELVVQLHPRAVSVVKIGGVTVSEAALAGMQAQQLLYLLTVLAGAFGLAALGADLVTALGGSVSALATMGPALGDLGPGSDALGVPAPARAVLMALMAVGRLSIAPVVVAFGAAGRILSRRLRS